MQKRVVLACVVIVFLLAACAPAATLAPTAAVAATTAAAPVVATTAAATAAPTTASTSSYTPPQGALAPVPLKVGSQFTGTLAFKAGSAPKIAYMPPTTNPYYNAIGEGIVAQAKTLGATVTTLAAVSDTDITGQMKQFQDVATMGVDAVIMHTHDDNAAAPLVKKLLDQGIAVIIVNSDIPSFPTPVNAVVGYGERKTTEALGEYIAKKVNGTANVGILAGAPGYDSDERVGGFQDAFKNYPGMKIVATLPTSWDQESGNTATMDMLQAHPEINLIVAANDFEAIGAAEAAKALNRTNVAIYGNDGDTTAMEEIYAGQIQGTSNTTPYVMGEVAMQVTMDVLNGKYPGGWAETPATIVNPDNALQVLCHPETLFPKPAKQYTCQ